MTFLGGDRGVHYKNWKSIQSFTVYSFERTRKRKERERYTKSVCHCKCWEK